MKKSTLLALLLGVIFLAALIYTSFGNASYRCRVCVTFQGRQSCQSAAAKTREQAVRAATDLACSDVSTGMSESTRCLNTPPDSVKWLAGR